MILSAVRGVFAVSGKEAALRKRGLNALVTRVTMVGRREPNASCEPQTSEIWFPTVPGTTVLPTAEEPVVNVSPAPPNSATLPEEFDLQDPDLCLLFQDILPVGVDPIYPVEQTAPVIAVPYQEIVDTVAIVYLKLATQRLNYGLRQDDREAIFSTRLVLAVINKILALGAGSFLVDFATAAIFRYTRNLRARSPGAFVLGRPLASFNYSRAIPSSAGQFLIDGQEIKLNKTRLPLAAESGSFDLSGKDALLTELEILSAEAGAYAFTGESAALVISRRLGAEIGEFDLQGNSARFAGILARDFDLVEIFEDDLLNLNL